MVACVGLVWMQVALKEDLDVIKEKFRTSKYTFLCYFTFALGTGKSFSRLPAYSEWEGTKTNPL